MADRLVPVGFWSYAVRPRGAVRFFATCRGTRSDGSPATTGDLRAALLAAGFGPDLLLWTDPRARPGDWPFERSDAAPPLGAGDVAVWGEGSWPTDKLPTAVSLPSGPSVQFWTVWEHTASMPVASSAGAPRARGRGAVASGDLLTFSVRPKRLYRFYATVRPSGAEAAVPEVWRALADCGFGQDLQLWHTGRPADWPSEDVPAIRVGEKIFRGEGRALASALPTIVLLPSGPALQLWSVWEHTGSGRARAGQAPPPLAEGFMAVAPLGLLVLGLFGLAVASTRRDR